MSSAAALLMMLVVGPLTGIVGAFLLARRPVLSGKFALALSLVPFVGVALGIIFC